MDIAEKTLQLKQDFDDVYKAGRTAQEIEWWTNFQTKRNSMSGYHYAFGWWYVEEYKPVLPITVRGADFMFRSFNYYGSPVDFVELHKELGIPDIDWSTATASCYDTFSYANISRLGVMDLSRAFHTQFFRQCSALVTIDELKLNPSASYTSLFAGCSKLANIKFGNNITQSLSFADSPLTKASIENVIEHLDDNVTGYTITFSKNAMESAFTTEEWAALIATKPNWSFSLI